MRARRYVARLGDPRFFRLGGRTYWNALSPATRGLFVRLGIDHLHGNRKGRHA